MTEPHRPGRPRDVVPRPGLTLKTIANLNQLAGRPVTFIEPGEIVLDVDDIPTAVGPSTETPALMLTPCITLAELNRLGGNPDDYPNIAFI